MNNLNPILNLFKIEEIDLYILSQNTNITPEFIIENLTIINSHNLSDVIWYNLTYNQSIPISFIESNPDFPWDSNC